jgi:hypothetical protein
MPTNPAQPCLFWTKWADRCCSSTTQQCSRWAVLIPAKVAARETFELWMRSHVELHAPYHGRDGCSWTPGRMGAEVVTCGCRRCLKLDRIDTVTAHAAGVPLRSSKLHHKITRLGTCRLKLCFPSLDPTLLLSATRVESSRFSRQSIVTVLPIRYPIPKSMWRWSRAVHNLYLAS